MIIKNLHTPLSAFEIFSSFKDRKHCIFLDSAMTHHELGRFSIIAFDPVMTFESKNGIVSIKKQGKDQIDQIYEETYSADGADPFEELKRLLNGFRVDYDGPLPFIGGAAGYFGYDLCHHLENLPITAVDDLQVPDCFFGIYDGAIVVDHFKGEVFAASPGLFSDAREWISRVETAIGTGEPSEAPQAPQTVLREPDAGKRFSANMDKAEYVRSISRIRDYIRAGDIYQVNMTNRFEGACPYSPHVLYERLRSINPAPFACYMDFGDGSIISSSPERFLMVRNGKAQTRPIKGTRPRGATPEEDRANRDALLASDKDKAELLMIVDLERNDLGRICKVGSVKVTELFKLEEYATVYHLVSTVEGELEKGTHAIDCVKAMFPGGSITGAPKIRAMEIIDELEPTTRNIYTGSIGYIGFNGHTDFNIAIRTIVHKKGRVYFQAGGGIVWDSQAEAEYDELLCKSAALMKAAGGSPDEGGRRQP